MLGIFFIFSLCWITSLVDIFFCICLLSCFAGPLSSVASYKKCTLEVNYLNPCIFENAFILLLYLIFNLARYKFLVRNHFLSEFLVLMLRYPMLFKIFIVFWFYEIFSSPPPPGSSQNCFFVPCVLKCDDDGTCSGSIFINREGYGPFLYSILETYVVL